MPPLCRDPLTAVTARLTGGPMDGEALLLTPQGSTTPPHRLGYLVTLPGPPGRPRRPVWAVYEPRRRVDARRWGRTDVLHYDWYANQPASEPRKEKPVADQAPWTPSPQDVAWTRNLIAMLKPGGVWGVPYCSATVTRDEHDPEKVTFRGDVAAGERVILALKAAGFAVEVIEA